MLTLAAVVALMNTCTAAHGVSSSGPAEVRIAGSGAYAAVTEKTAVAAFDSATYERELERLLGDSASGEIPGIEFESEAAVILVGGQRNSGGYFVDVRGASVEGDTLIIDAVVQGPPPDSIVTQALTSPWAVVAVRNRDFKTVQWKE
jgi:hypothetical protein